jgi:hypothetical protein
VEADGQSEGSEADGQSEGQKQMDDQRSGGRLTIELRGRIVEWEYWVDWSSEGEGCSREESRGVVRVDRFEGRKVGILGRFEG